MGLQINSSAGTQGMAVFQSKNLEDVPGGLTLDEDDNNFDAGVIVQKGELCIYSEATRLVVIDKLATVYEEAGASATAYKVNKGHCLSVGDVVSTGAVGDDAATITAIDTTTSDDYDTLTLSATITAVTAGDVLWLSSAVGATAGAFLGTPNGILKNDADPTGGNVAVSVVTKGTVYERRLPGIYGGHSVPAAKKTAMSDRILFSQSF